MTVFQMSQFSCLYCFVWKHVFTQTVPKSREISQKYQLDFVAKFISSSMKDEQERTNKLRSGFEEVDYWLVDAQRSLFQKGQPEQSILQPAGIYHCMLEGQNTTDHISPGVKG